MNTQKISHFFALVGTVVFVGAGSSTFAADSASGIYGSVRVGPTFVGDMNFSESTTADLNLNSKTGWMVGGAVGYRFYDTFRLEFDLAYGSNDLNGTFQQNVQAFVPCGETPGNPCLDPSTDGDLESLSGFATVYYDFPALGQIRPYAGIGVGFVDIDLDVGTRATLNDGPASRFTIINGSDTVLGYRGSLGLIYPIGSADLNLGYTYTFTDRPNFAGQGTLVSFNFDRKVHRHAVAAGLTYRF